MPRTLCGAIAVVLLAGIALGDTSARVIYDGGRGLFYIGDRGTDQVLVFSPVDRTVIGQIPVGHLPYGLAMAPDGQRLYVAIAGDDPSGLGQVCLPATSEETWP